MTSTPVKNVGFGLGGPTPAAAAGAKAAMDGGFQTVWNNQAGKQADSAGQPEDGKTVKKAPGDSLKARDEHRARTEKREPSRNVEERTDIPDEKLEEAAEVLEAAAVQVIQEVADTFGMEPAEVQEIMADLGMEQTDVLSAQGLSSLILAVSGEESSQALLTNEELYGSYQELMGRLEAALQECSETLEVSPEQLDLMAKSAVRQLQPEESADEAIQLKVVEEPRESKKTADGKPDEGLETVRPVEQKAVEQTRDGESAGGNHDRKENRHEHEGGREQGLNLFAQNLKAEQFEPQVQQTSGTESVWDTDTQNIMRQIMDYMKVNLKADMSTMEMQLHPASLGTLQVQVASKGGVVTANFITQNEAVKAALESQMVQLREQFEEQGVKVEAIEVTVQTHQFEQNLEQGRRGSGQEQEPARKGRTRRINLNDSLPPEDMEEEDVLAKDIMIANGNTVDYTA